jgi:predicted amidohydrolase YtcJ
VPAHADLVLRGGNILTLDRASRRASALAVRGERIAFVGSDRDVAAHVGPRTRVLELGGRTAMPGLTDGHAHLDREGLKGLLPSLAGCRSIRELVDRLARLAAGKPDGTWIVTLPIGEPPEHRWSEAMFEEARLPTRHDLDLASTRHPILIRSAWGYWPGELPLVSFANSAALAAAGVGKDTASPSPLVEIERDAHGEPTGVFRENAFQPIVEFTLFRQAPQFTEDDRARTLGESMRLYNAVGTTAVFEGHGAADELINAYRRTHAEGRRTVRATLAFSPGWSDASAAVVEQWVKVHAARLRGRGEGDAWLRVAGLFAEVDAAPRETRLRARCRPRTGWAGFNYDAGLPRELLAGLLAAAARERLRVCAIQAPMLELFAEAAREAPIEDLRWVIAHPVTLDAAQIARIRELGVCITTHTNAYVWKRASAVRARVGAEREETICPIRSLLEAGVPVSLATDNLPISLWPCIWQAVERVDRDTGSVVAPGQRIGREQALRCATTHGAWLCLDEGERGSLEPGRLADLIVLPEDPLTVSAERLPALAPDLTVVGGRTVWERSAS